MRLSCTLFKPIILIGFLLFSNVLTAQVYSDVGAWYYGMTFKATIDGYLNGFTIYANAPNPSNALVWIYGPFNAETDASSLIAGSDSANLHTATPLVKYSAISGFTASSSPASSYDGSSYGIGYVQGNPDTKILVLGQLSGVQLEEDKYYLAFFAVSNATYVGNQYRVARLIDTEPTGSGYELEKTYYLSPSSPYQREISSFYLDMELNITQENCIITMSHLLLPIQLTVG